MLHPDLSTNQTVHSVLPTQHKCLWFTVLTLIIPSVENTSNLSSCPECQLTLLKCLLTGEVTREAYPDELSQILCTPPSPVHVISPFTTWLFLNPYDHTHIHTISFSVSFCLKVKCMHVGSIFILFTALATYSTILPYSSYWFIYLQNLWHSRNFLNVSLMNILKKFIFERKKKWCHIPLLKDEREEKDC